MRFLTLFALLLSLVLLSVGCAKAPRHPPIADLTAEEQQLLTYLTRDPFLHVDHTERDVDGYLVLTTHQGNSVARYQFAPEVDGPKELKIHRMVDDLVLKTEPSDSLGTSMDPRRLQPTRPKSPTDPSQR